MHLTILTYIVLSLDSFFVPRKLHVLSMMPFLQIDKMFSALIDMLERFWVKNELSLVPWN